MSFAVSFAELASSTDWIGAICNRRIDRKETFANPPVYVSHVTMVATLMH
jgi:hypothetical protein